MKQLHNFNWNNVFAAGGSVFACTRPVPFEYQSRKFEFFHDIAYETSDIDLFIYGLTVEESREKLIEIYRAVKNSPDCDIPIDVLASDNTVTFIRKYPYRCIQVVLSNFQYPSEVLANLDIDSVCFGYDGKDVYCLPKARTAVNTGVSIINNSLKRISYRRLDKWQSRGVRFALPTFITVPLDQKEQDKGKLLRFLALAKMNLLHSYNIKFDYADNVRFWDMEFAYGCTFEGRERGIDKRLPHYSEYFGIQFEPHRHVQDDDPILTWDSSIGALGSGYTKVSNIKGVPMEEEELRTKWASVREKWTWEGAPEFRDWNYNAKQKVEAAVIRMVPRVIHPIIPWVAPKSSHKVSFKDSFQNEWTLHFENEGGYLAISLELDNVSVEVVPVIGIFHLKSKKVSVRYDITHLFDKERPRSMEFRVYSKYLVDLYENGKLKMKVDMKIMQQLFPY